MFGHAHLCTEREGPHLDLPTDTLCLITIAVVLFIGIVYANPMNCHLGPILRLLYSVGFPSEMVKDLIEADAEEEQFILI